MLFRSLTIVQRLVDLMGGQVQAESVPGKGSCFSFEVPLQGGVSATVSRPGELDEALV